ASVIEPLQDANLREEANLIVEELLLHDLAIFPAGHRAELQLEPLVRRRVKFAVQTLPGADHSTRPTRDRAGPIARGDHHFVGIVCEMVLDRFEKELGLVPMCVAST